MNRNVKNIKNTKWIAAALVVGVTFCGTFALAQTRAPAGTKTTAKTETDDWQTRAKAAIARTLMKYVYQYKPADDQKAKLEKALIAQYKDLMDFDKILTEEQRKAGSSRSSRSSSSGKRPVRSPTKRTTRPIKTKTPK